MLTVSHENLQGVVTNALERMAFVFTDYSELTAGEVLARSSSHSSIELRGPRSYTVTVSATDGLIQEVASGMMGCEPEDIDVDEHMSFLEMFDVLNEKLLENPQTYPEGPVAFDHDCREGICGMCSMVINGVPHGPNTATTTCQLHMRSYKNGDEITVATPRGERNYEILSFTTIHDSDAS